LQIFVMLFFKSLNIPSPSRSGLIEEVFRN